MTRRGNTHTKNSLDRLDEPGVSTATSSSASAPALRVTHPARYGTIGSWGQSCSAGPLYKATGRGKQYSHPRTLKPTATQGGGTSGRGRRRHGRGPVLVRAGAGLRPPGVRAAAPVDGSGSFAVSSPSHNPPYGTLTPHRPHQLRILTSRRPSTNLEHAVCTRNLLNPRSLNRFRQTRPA